MIGPIQLNWTDYVPPSNHGCITLYLYCHWRSNYQERGGGEGGPINPATFLSLLQARTWISNTIFHGLCYVQWFQVRVDCSFCWYLWNCWSSLFKLSFHNIITFTVPGLTKWQRPWIIATSFPCINLFLNIHIILNSYRSHISYTFSSM
jgi:hypothetical protein